MKVQENDRVSAVALMVAGDDSGDTEKIDSEEEA
jgi:hypothetical protein